MEQNLSGLVLRNLNAVMGILTEAKFEVYGNELAPITQELATLEMLARRLAAGTLEVIEPVQEALENVGDDEIEEEEYDDEGEFDTE